MAMPGYVDPNQVTTKPRQMPSGGGDMVDPPDQQGPGQDMAPDPSLDSPSDDQPDGSDDAQVPDDPTGHSSVAAIARDVLAHNPGVPRREAVRIAARAYHRSGGRTTLVSLGDGA